MSTLTRPATSATTLRRAIVFTEMAAVGELKDSTATKAVMCRSRSLRHDGPTFERRVQGGCSPSRVSGKRCTNASTRHGTARVHPSTIDVGESRSKKKLAREDKKSKTSCDISSKTGNSVSISSDVKRWERTDVFEVNLQALAFRSAQHPPPPSSTSKHKRFSF